MGTKDLTAWAKYKKVRNEITSQLWRAKASIFSEKIDSAKSATV